MVVRKYNNEYFRITENRKLIKVRFKHFEKIPLKYTEITRSPYYFDHKFNRDLMYKKRMRAYFGNIRIRNLRMLFIKSKKSNVNKGNSFFQTLEMRLDRFLMSLKFAFSINHAKQLILHNKILVNNYIMNKYKYKVKRGDTIEFIFEYRLLGAKSILNRLANIKFVLFINFLNFFKNRKYFFNLGCFLFLNTFFFSKFFFFFIFLDVFKKINVFFKHAFYFSKFFLNTFSHFNKNSTNVYKKHTIKKNIIHYLAAKSFHTRIIHIKKVLNFSSIYFNPIDILNIHLNFTQKTHILKFNLSFLPYFLTKKNMLSISILKSSFLIKKLRILTLKTIKYFKSNLKYFNTKVLISR